MKTKNLLTLRALMTSMFLMLGMFFLNAQVQMDLPVNFEGTTIDYGVIGFEGAEASTIEVDPTDASNTVVKVIKANTAQPWAGTTVTAAAALGFASPIPLTATTTQMSVRVWSPDAGIQVRLKVEDHTNPTISVETEATTTVANGWQTLVFNFANQATGTAALNLANTYDKASIFFNYGVNGATAGTKTYYFDDVMMYQPTDLIITTTVCNTASVVRLTGPFWGWDPNAGPVAVNNGNGTFTFTFAPAPTANMEYLLIVDGVQENLISAMQNGGTCAPITDYANYANRVWNITDPLTVSNTYGQCTACTPSTPTDLIITATVCNTASVVRLTGPFWGWDPNAGPVAVNNGNGTFTFTFAPAPTANMEYLLIVDGVQENLISAMQNGGTCAPITDYANYANRVWNLTDPLTVSNTYGQCTACATVNPNQMDLPVTFEGTVIEYGVIGFEGAEASTIEVDPTDAANTVVKVVKVNTAQPWAGTTVTAPATLGFANPIPFTASQKQMSVRVWSPDAGIQVRLKVEKHNDPTISVETEATTTVANGWQTLVFNFANQATGTAALNLANTYDKASIFFNFGVNGATAGEKTYYFDDVMMNSSLPTTNQMDLPVTFEGTVIEYGVIGFEGAEASTIEVDPTDATNTVVKVVKVNTAQPWAGTTVTAPAAMGLANPIPFTATETQMSVRVWSPDAGIQVRLKVEDHSDATISVETEATTTVANGWQTLVFNFANQATGTAALNLANSYDKASIFFNFGVNGATAGEKTYYFDDLMMNSTSSGNDLLITVDVCAATPNEVRLTGPFWSWDPTAGPTAVDNGNGTWTFTFAPAPTTDMEYLIIVDGVQENLIADMQNGGTCAPVTDYFAYANRKWVVGSGDVSIAYDRCVPCSYPDLIITTEVCDAATQVNLTGPIWDWNPAFGPQAVDNGDGTWTFTISPAPTDTLEYLLVKNGVTENLIQEMVNGGGCAPLTDYSTYANRRWIIGQGEVANTYGKCGACLVGIDETSFENLMVYPNPTSAIFTVSNSTKIEKVTLYSIIGEKVLEKSIQSTTSTLDLSAMASGIYHLNIQVGGETKTIQLIKE